MSLTDNSHSYLTFCCDTCKILVLSDFFTVGISFFLRNAMVASSLPLDCNCITLFYSIKYQFAFRYNKYIDLACKGIISPEKLPPSERAAYFHGLRCHYQIFLFYFFYAFLSRDDNNPHKVN